MFVFPAGFMTQEEEGGGGDTIESGATRHWLFGSDNTENRDQVGNVAMVQQGGKTAPTLSSGYLSLAAQQQVGLRSDTAEAVDFTVCYVFRRPSSGQIVLAGTYGGSGGQENNGMLVEIQSGGNVRALLGGAVFQNIKTITNNTWNFMAFSYSGTTFRGFAGASGGNTEVTRVQAHVADTPPNNHCASNYYYNSPNYNATGIDFAEMIIFTESKNFTELDAIYQNSVTRMSDRGITLV